MNTSNIVKLFLFLIGFVLTNGNLATAQENSKTETRELKANEFIEREIAGAETHLYKIILQTNEFFQVRVEQKGIDVALNLIDAEGKILTTTDSPSGNEGIEILSYISKSIGIFLLEVKSSKDKLIKGHYTIQRVVSRTATEDDRKLIESEKEQQILLETLINEVPQLINKTNPSTTSDSFQTTLSKTTKGLEIAQKIKSLELEALFTFFFARIYEEKGDFGMSLEFYKKALKVINVDEKKKVKLKFMEIPILKKMGRIYQNKFSNAEEAAKLYYRGLSLYKDNEEDQDKGLLLRYFADTLTEFRFYQQAEETYMKSVSVFQNLKLPFEVGATLGKLGRVYFERGDTPTEALKYLLESEKLLEFSPPNSEYQNTRLFNLGYIYLLYEKLNDQENATLFKNKAKTLENKTNDSLVSFVNKFLFANSLMDKGKTEEALKVYQEALDLAHKIEGWDSTTSKVQVLQKMIRLYFILNKYEEAKNAFSKAYELVKDLSDHTELALLLERYADILTEGQAFELAANYYYQSLSVLMSKENRPIQINFEQIARVQNKWGKLQLEVGIQAESLTNLRTSLLLQMSLYQQIDLADMLEDRMVIFNKLNKNKLAIFFGKQSILLKQGMRLTIKSFPTETQKTFLKGNRRTYQMLISLLLQEKRFAEAIQIINFYQNQEFYDFNKNEETLYKTVSFTEREKSYLTELQSLQKSLKESKENFMNNPDFDRLDELLTKIENDFSSPPDEKDKLTVVIDSEDMKTTIFELSKSTKNKVATMYTLIGNDKFHTLLLMLDGKTLHFETSIKADELNNKISKFYALLQSDQYDTTVLGKELYDIIFKPIEADLKKQNVKTLMWQLDGNLRYIPIAALYDGKQFLAERYQNVIFTRADKDRLTRDVKSTWKGVGFGTSEFQKIDLFGEKIDFDALSGVTQELQSIFSFGTKKTGILDGEIVLDKNFTKENFYQAIEKKRTQQGSVVHISSHFSFRPGDESRSFLVMGDGSALTLSELKNHPDLFKGIDLLTLSACNTAAAQANSNGKEIDGFAELAQRLGASAVIATLWQVSDASTPWLMRDFYATRQGKIGTTKAEALQKAQLALLYGTAKPTLYSNATKGTANSVKLIVTKDGKPNGQSRGDEIIYVSVEDAPPYQKDDKKPFAHPYYWSPFILIGNWK